ncbi:MAG: PAS domain S-box protein [Candidatus Omnitrophota bacterium]
MSPRRAKKSTKRARQMPGPAGVASLQASKKANTKFQRRILRQRGTKDAFLEGGWKVIFENSQEGVLIVDAAQKKFLNCNKKIAKMLGYSKKEVLSLSVKDIHPPKELKHVLAAFDLLAVGRVSVAENVVVRRKDGSFFYADISSSCVKFSGRKCLIGFFRDVTERNKSKEALIESEEMFRTLTERSSNMIFINQGGRVVYVNPKCEKIMGYTRKEFCSPRFNFLTLMHLEDIPKVRRSFLAYQKGREVAPYEYKMVTKGGKPIHGILTSKLIHYRGTPAILGIITDITERKRGEASLAQREAHISSIIENQPGMVWLKDTKGRFLAVNRKFADAGKLKDPQKVIGKTDFDIWPKELARKYQTDDKRVMKTGKAIMVEEPISVCGVRKWYETFKTPVRNEKGDILGTSGYAQDVTERKKAEASLRLAYFSIDHAAASIFQIDPQARFLYVNDTACKTLGYSRKELLSMMVHDIDPDFPASIWPAHWSKLRRKKHMNFETTHKTKNGRIFPVEININFLKFEGREYNVAFAHDISKHKKAEEELKKILSLERATLESTADGILVVENGTGKVADFNARFSKLWNIPDKILRTREDEKLLKCVLSQLKDPGRFLSKVGELYRHPRKESFDVLEFKDGKIFERYSRPQFVDGKPVGRVWNFRDVTEREKSEELLRKTAKEWRATFDAVGDAVWLLSLDGRILRTNKAASRMFGKDIAKILGRSCCEVVHGSKAPPPGCPLRRIRESLHREFWETSFLNRWFRITVDPVLNEKGALTGVVHIVTDITDRKRADEAVLKVTRFNEAIIESLPGVFYVFDSQGKFLRINKKFSEVTKYSLKKILQMHPLDFVPQEEKARVKDAIREVFEKGESSVEACFLSKDGQKTPYFFTGIRAIVGSSPLLVGVGIDIAERKSAENFLREHRRQLLQVIDTVPHMIFAKDRKGRFLLVNQAVAQAYEKEPKDLIGVRRQDIHKIREEAKSFSESDKEVLSSGNPKVIPEEFFTDVRGRRHVLRTVRIPFRMVGAKEDCILGVSVDVTEQKKVEEFRNEIVRTVSHELRTPLSIQKEGISLLMDEMMGPVNAGQREILEAVMRSIDRLAHMISSLLDVSSIETRKIKLFRKMVNLGDLIKGIVLDFKKRGDEKHIDLSVKLPERLARVLIDPDKITQVLSNLVDNAIKFTPEGGAVQISLVASKNKVECEVRDTGIGIAPENLDKMFEKFQQFSRADGPGKKGFGLGLSIAKGIIELHGGRIWIKSEFGKGTRVTFSLPLYRRRED